MSTKTGQFAALRAIGSACTGVLPATTDHPRPYGVPASDRRIDELTVNRRRTAAVTRPARPRPHFRF